MAAKPPKLTFATLESIRDYRRKHGMNQSEFWSRVQVMQSGGLRDESGRIISCTPQNTW